jgi:phytoene dehydrogenase-like protein
MAATWDTIVIGGGHNGLVAGAYLAKAGARTVVLEARHKTGGAAATDTRGRRRPTSASPASPPSCA